MNLVFLGIVIFIFLCISLFWFANASSKKISKGLRGIIIFGSLIIAIILTVGGRFLFSFPLLLLAVSAFKIKGLTAIQIFQLWRLINFLRNSGRFSYYGKTNTSSQLSTTLSLDEAYKILGVKEGSTKDQVRKAANKIQKKIHPDVSPETSRLSALVNEARDIIIKNIS